jgi:hypothetical protein
MNDEELQRIIDTLRGMEGRFEPPTTAAGPHLNSADRATVKRLLMEAKSILDDGLGIGNNFSLAISGVINAPGLGFFNPPSLEQLQEAIGATEGGLNQLRRKQNRPSTPLGAAGKPTYVDLGRMGQLQGIKSSQWDLKRLVRLLQELNISHANDMHMATAMLVRAVADHVPPIFNVRNFSEVANNYPAPRSFSDQMKHLDNSLRKIADTHLHLPVRKTEVLPTAPQVDFRGALDVLLSEVVRLLQ